MIQRIRCTTIKTRIFSDLSVAFAQRFVSSEYHFVQVPMNKLLHVVFLWLAIAAQCFSQGSPPWNNALKMAWSPDGRIFNTPTVFQDSAGVPSVIRWHGDTLIAAFQWFRRPNPSPTWDRVAVKYSFDSGISWTQPVPIIVNGLPAHYQRPFDPTLALVGGDSIRIYFSSSDGIPGAGQDSSINTYSALSADGVNFVFEPGARVDHPSNRIIDPAVVHFNNVWHYSAPIGSPQQGAWHYVSPDGLNFSPVATIPSDNTHNWTGNYMVESDAELRFYGSGPLIWYNASVNGGVWNGYVPTNIQGGDPSVVKIATGNYLIIFVGRPQTSIIEEIPADDAVFSIYPNPASDMITVASEGPGRADTFLLFDMTGRLVLSVQLDIGNSFINLRGLADGCYLLRPRSAENPMLRVVKR